MRDHYKSRFPAFNVPRRPEPVATDWVYSDTPAIDDGAKGAQVFIGIKSLVTDVFGAKTDGQYVNHLENVIRKRGAMDTIVSDRGSSIVSKKAQDIYRMLFIKEWQSEPDHQHQNPFERRFQTIKNWTNNVMNRTGAPPYTWLLALTYVCMILNVLASPSLDGQIPLTVLTGQVVDISPYLQFAFYEPVYIKRSKQDFPSQSEEVKGRWVGFAEGIGDAMTWKVLLDDTLKVVPRSVVRSAVAKDNLRLEADAGEDEDSNNNNTSKMHVKSRGDNFENPSGFQPMALFDPDDLIGRSYLSIPEDNGEKFRARVKQKIIDNDEENVQDRVKFLVRTDGEKADEIITYTQLCDYLE